MAGKEAIVFIVDCHRSMAEHMNLAREAVRVLMAQKMLQNKQHEMGVLLFGLPEEETANKLHEDGGGYEGVKELCIVDRGNLDYLRKLKEIEVPDAGNTDGVGDVLDAMVVGLHMIRQRTLNKAFARHAYLLTDAATPVEELDQLESIVNMYVDPSMQCKLHFVGFGTEPPLSRVVKEEGSSKAAAEGTGMNGIKEQNEKMLASVAAATNGSVMPAKTVVDVMGKATIKTVNPVLSKVDLEIGSKLVVHCRYFQKTDTSLKESLKKESIGSFDAKDGSTSAGKVRVDRTYRDPEIPEVEVEYENQVKGYRYGQDYIPVGPLDEGSLKLPEEGPSLKVLGFVPAGSVSRHLFMDDTVVVGAEPGSLQSAGAVSSLVAAMTKLQQLAVVRFVKRKSAAPWLGILLPDATGVSVQPRWLLQKYPFSEDVRDYTFPSFIKATSARRPSEDQMKVSSRLVDAMMLPNPHRYEGGIRDGLVLNPVRQGINGAKIARALEPDCQLPEIPPSVKAGVSPEPALIERARPVFKDYLSLFQFEKQDRAKAGKKRVTYFSDLTLAEPDAPSGPTEGAGDGVASKKTRIGCDQDRRTKAKSDATASKVGSINPVSDFEAMMTAARDGSEGCVELAERAVEQMQSVIHALVRKGTTSALRTKALDCMKALRKASLGHFMGQRYNDFLRDVKARYHAGDNSDIWDMAVKAKEVWPITTNDDGSLEMTAKDAAEVMTMEAVKDEEEEVAKDSGDDDDLDDMA